MVNSVSCLIYTDMKLISAKSDVSKNGFLTLSTESFVLMAHSH